MAGAAPRSRKAQETRTSAGWPSWTDPTGSAGRPNAPIFGVPPGSSPVEGLFRSSIRTIARRCAAGAAAGGGNATSSTVVRPDGLVRWSTSGPHRPGPRAALRMVGTVDITERLEDQLVSQKDEALGRLARARPRSNNALTAIGGYAELARRGAGGSAAARRRQGNTARAAERASSVTRQLLASRRRLLGRVFDLNQTIAAIARMLSRLLSADVDVQTAGRLGAAGAGRSRSVGRDQPRGQRATRCPAAAGWVATARETIRRRLCAQPADPPGEC
jgi:hypothetical protein